MAAVAVAALGLLVRRGRLRRQRDPDPDQQRPVHESGTTHQHKTQLEPDSFGFGNTIVALTQSGRYFNGGGRATSSGRPRRRRTHVDDGRPARNDRQRRTVRGRGSATRPSPTTRARRLARSRPRLRRGRQRPHPARQPLHRRRPDLVESGHRRDAPGPPATRTGSRATRWRRARTTATATPSSTTTAPGTSCR